MHPRESTVADLEETVVRMEGLVLEDKDNDDPSKEEGASALSDTARNVVQTPSAEVE